MPENLKPKQRRLPFTTPHDLKAWRQVLCVPEERLNAVFTTSGTTGEPKRVYYTSDDMMVVGNLNLYGSVIADAVGRVVGTSGRVLILLDQVDLIDWLVLRVEGTSVLAEDVLSALATAYPESPGNIANGSLLLKIETDIDLGTQIKSLKIVDMRRTEQLGTSR